MVARHHHCPVDRTEVWANVDEHDVRTHAVRDDSNDPCYRAHNSKCPSTPVEAVRPLVSKLLLGVRQLQVAGQEAQVWGYDLNLNR